MMKICQLVLNSQLAEQFNTRVMKKRLLNLAYLFCTVQRRDMVTG
jgi:hypothetical protein